MVEEPCALCGQASQLSALERHHIVPRELTSQAGIPDSVAVTLCSNCHREAHAWYSKKVFDMTYDTMAKHFKLKPVDDMVKEYEVAFGNFTQYKKGYLL